MSKRKFGENKRKGRSRSKAAARIRESDKNRRRIKKLKANSHSAGSEDMPDGAFFAAAEESDLEPEDFLDDFDEEEPNYDILDGDLFSIDLEC